MELPKPKTHAEALAEERARLEKVYNAPLITPGQLKEEATAFYHWLDDILEFSQEDQNPPENYLLFKRTYDEATIKYAVHIFTDRFRYDITAAPPQASPKGYLGASMTMRKPYVGEEHHRGSDLPDGPYEQDTWRKIQSAIIRSEMVDLECFRGGGPGSEG